MENTGNSSESALSIFDTRAVTSGFIDSRVGRVGGIFFSPPPGNQADYPEKNSAVGRDWSEGEMKANNYPAGTYVNGGELINLEFSFVLGNELD